MFRCPSKKCNRAQYFSQPFPKPGRNVFTLRCRYSDGLKRRSVSDAMIDIMGRTRRPSQTKRGNKDVTSHPKSAVEDCSDGGRKDKGNLQI